MVLALILLLTYLKIPVLIDFTLSLFLAIKFDTPYIIAIPISLVAGVCSTDPSNTLERNPVVIPTLAFSIFFSISKRIKFQFILLILLH